MIRGSERPLRQLPICPLHPLQLGGWSCLLFGQAERAGKQNLFLGAEQLLWREFVFAAAATN
jgi:hypothetical protein